MKFGDLNIEQHKAILTMANSITLLNGGYKLYYNTFYLNTYDPSTFEAYYNNLHHALTHNLLVEDIVIQDMDLDSNNQYYDDELGRSVLILDKDHMVEGLNIQLRDSAGMTKRFKLSDLDLGSYTLTYTYNEDLTPILVDLTYQGFEISF